MLLPSLVDIDRALVDRGTFYDFVEMAWPVIEPSTFVPNWHIAEVCTHLEAVSRVEIRNLVINQPPGTSKSTIVGVLWNVWEWLKHPSTKYIYSSFDLSLSCRDAAKVVKLLNSDWFVERWGRLLTRLSPAISDFGTVGGGFRFSTSVGGKGTGRHGDIVVVDDPIKPRDALGGGVLTKRALRNCSDWWANTMSSRRADPKTFRRVIVMQRLHDSDLAGEAVASGDYVHLCLPMHFDPDYACSTQWGGDRRSERGELLFPGRFPPEAVTALERDMGPDVAAAQLEQRPSQKRGGLFRREWFRFWHTKPNQAAPCLCEDCWRKGATVPGHSGADTCAALPDTGLQIQSWDFAFKGASTSDFCAGGLWLASRGNYFLRDCVNARMILPEAIKAIKAWREKYPSAHDILIEDAANGPAIEQTLRGAVHGITLCKPLGGKEARAAACSPRFAAGCVFVPHPSLAPWVWQYLRQVESFPKAANDDMVDQTSQALIRLHQYGADFSRAMARIRGE